MSEKYNVGFLYYGSIYANIYINSHNIKSNDFQIVDGPFVPVKLSGLAFIDTLHVKLTRNLHPTGELIKSSIVIFKTFNIKSVVKEIAKREYYTKSDMEPICYLKKKTNNRCVLKIPYFCSYDKIFVKYGQMIKYLNQTLGEFAIKNNLDYIFFVSYDHRVDVLNIDHTLTNLDYFDQMKIIFNQSDNQPNNQLILNTQNYLKFCDWSTYTDIEKYILDIKLGEK
jgi:hypothetical protein